jgi:DNA-directed RNA polymerase sigma subunit (sigma70/sigma32)
MAKSRANSKFEDDFSDYLDNSDPDYELLDNIEDEQEKEENESDEESDEVALVSSLENESSDEYDLPEIDADWVGTHPAEIAAALAKKLKSEKSPGGSDEEILKDLRKCIFSIPLMQQSEVCEMFKILDQILYSVVFRILEVSDFFWENLFQIVVKIAAGNTYGKNIYEKGSDKESSRGVYKQHELNFLSTAYPFVKIFAETYENPDQDRTKFKDVLDPCGFIRGVWEDVVFEFIKEIKHYDDLHNLAQKYHVERKYEALTGTLDLITRLDAKLKLVRPAYGITRDSLEAGKRYSEVRSRIISPYLRSAYTAAKSTARNAHQMLDNFQNGSIGLMRAISCYSLKRGSVFPSVAKWWIKQMMLLSIKEDANFVKLPVSTWQAYTQLERAKLKSGNEEDLESIAKIAKMPIKKAEAVYHAVKVSQVYSLNKTYDSDDKMSLEDVLSEDPKLTGWNSDIEELLRDYCLKAELVKDELQVLALRFGMPDLISSLQKNKVTENEARTEVLNQNLAKIGYFLRRSAV